MPKYPPPNQGDGLGDISSAGLRAAFRLAEIWESGKLFPPTKTNSQKRSPRSGSVSILNKTGMNLPRYSVVGIDGPHAPPVTDSENPKDRGAEEAFWIKQTVAASKPTVRDHFKSFAITTHGIPVDGLGVAKLDDVSIVRIRVPASAGHFRRAGIVEGDTDALHVHPGGPCDILWIYDEKIYDTEGEETDLHWAMVQFEQVPMGWDLTRNNDSDPVPPYGVVKIDGWSIPTETTSVTSPHFADASKPENDRARQYAVNGPPEILPSKYGYMYHGEDPVWVRISDTKTPVDRANWGPVGGAYHIGEEYAGNSVFGFEVLGSLLREDSGKDRRMLCRRRLIRELTVTPGATPGDGGSVECLINSSDGTLNGRPIKVSDNRGGNTTARIRLMEGDDKWAFIDASSAPRGIMKATSNGIIDVGAGGGPATLKESSEVITAYLNWMHNDEAISAGKQILVQWFGEEEKWVIIGAECEEEEEPPPPFTEGAT